MEGNPVLRRLCACGWEQESCSRRHTDTIVRVKWRWLLPFGNVLVDCILLLALASYSERLLRPKGSLYSSPRIESAMFLQEGIPFEPTNLPPAGPYLLFVTGNLPAGMISEVLVPRRGERRHWQQLDAVRVLVYEAAAFLCWYGIGLYLESHRRTAIVLLAYLVVRFLLALAGVYEIGFRVQVLFWLGCTAWLLGLGVTHMLRFAVKAARRM